MGEGEYKFFTTIGEDDVMFNVIDAFVQARLHEKANMNAEKKTKTVSDDEILYDKLHKSALGDHTNPGLDMRGEKDFVFSQRLP